MIAHIGICVLLIIIIVMLYRKNENMSDVPKFYTSGASMRVLAQKFSSADQAVVTVQDDKNNKRAVVLTAQNGIVNPDLSGYVGTGDAHMYTSGASMRVLDQVFSSTDQAPSVAVHSTDDPNMPPLYLRAALVGR
jgi:hypothetical protein